MSTVATFPAEFIPLPLEIGNGDFIVNAKHTRDITVYKISVQTTDTSNVNVIDCGSARMHGQPKPSFVKFGAIQVFGNYTTGNYTKNRCPRFLKLW